MERMQPIPQRIVKTPQQPDDGARLPPASRAQEDRADLVRADLVGDPRLLGAAREGVSEPPGRPEGDDQPRRRDEAHGEPGDPHPEVADHERQTPAVRVRHDAGRHLEEEDRRLHRGSHQHELERREVKLADEVHRHHDPRGHVAAEAEPVVDGGRPEPPHPERLSFPCFFA
jgi:hypothetical protein